MRSRAGHDATVARIGSFGAAVACLFVVVGCAVQPSSTPVQIDGIDFEATPTGADADAEGIDRVYLVGPGEDQLLRSVPRTATSNRNLIELLFNGPNAEEQQQNYFSAIPAGTEIISVSTIGSALFLDITGEITELSGPALTRALAQIVYTATDQEGIEAVWITVDGEDVPWPGIGGEPGRSLRVYDFPDVVETSQLDYPALPVVPEGDG